MILAPLLALAVAATPKVFLSVDRTFLPDTPGSVVRVELEGSASVDVRLYQLKDPERFLGGAEDLTSAVAAPANAARSPSMPALLARGATGVRQALHGEVEPVFTPAAREAVRLLAPGTLVPPPHELPLLKGEPLLRRWTLPCGGNEAHHYCDADLGTLPAGVYLIEGVAGGQAGYALAVVSRLALVARHTPGQLLIAAADARTGEPRPNVQLTFSGPSQPPLKGSTNVGGLFLLKPPTRSGRVVARAGSDWAALEVPAVAPHLKAARVWVAPTRGEARPGETLRLLGAERPAPNVARELPASLEDGRGTPVAAGLLHQDPTGLFSGELAIPPEAAVGLAHVVVEVDGRQVSGELWLRDPPPPDLLASATLQLAAQKLTAEVRARDASGQPVASTVEWRVLRAPLEGEGASGFTEVVDEGEATAGTDGRAQVELELEAGPDGRFIFEAAATDGWGHRAPCQAEAVRLRGPAHVSVVPDRRVYAPGETAKISLRATDASGRPAAVGLSLRTTVSRAGSSGETAPTPVGSSELTLSASGTGELALPNLQPGYYEVEARAGATRVGEAVLYVSLHGGDIPFTPDALTVLPDKESYLPGETARVLVFAPFESGSALVTVIAGEAMHGEVLPIRGSSALLTHKVAAGSGTLTFAAAAVLNGQSYAASRTARVLPAIEPASVAATLEPGLKPGTLELTVHARDGAGRPLAGAQALAAWHAADAPPTLAPPLASFLDPPPAAEGRTDVSLDFRSAGQSTASRPRIAALGPAAFTPQKGLGNFEPRPPHATIDGLERLPATDRNGVAHLVLPAGDAHALSVLVLAALPGPDPRAPPQLASASAEREVPGVSAVPELPPVLRSNDRALATVSLLPGLVPSSALVGGRAVPVAPGPPVAATLSLDAQHPAYRVESGGRVLLDGRVPVVSGEEWVTAQAGELPTGTLRLVGEAEEGTLRIRVVSGPEGLLKLLADARRPPPRAQAFEQAPSSDLAPDTDGRLASLALALASAELHPDAAGLAPRVAAVVALFDPAGELGAYPGAPYDRERTALALWLLTRAQALGAGVPTDWLDRVRSRLGAELDRPGPGRALSALALGAQVPELQPESLTVPALAAWTLLATRDHDPRATDLASRLERSAGTAGSRACWADDGCDPRAPASVASLTGTAWAALALAEARPRSPRLAGALRYLLDTRDQAVWGRGRAGALLPLALLAGRHALPDRPATLRLLAPGAGGEVKLAAGDATVLYASGGPASLKVKGGPVSFELARARAEPEGAQGELSVTRRYLLVHRVGERVERQPIAGKVARGAEVLVELTVTGASAGTAVQLDDRPPGGLRPIGHPGKSDPAAELEDRGGAVTVLADRVHLAAIATEGPMTLSYLARATLAGHYVAPPAQASAGELAGRSAQAELDVEAAP